MPLSLEKLLQILQPAANTGGHQTGLHAGHQGLKPAAGKVRARQLFRRPDRVLLKAPEKGGVPLDFPTSSSTVSLMPAFVLSAPFLVFLRGPGGRCFLILPAPRRFVIGIPRRGTSVCAFYRETGLPPGAPAVIAEGGGGRRKGFLAGGLPTGISRENASRHSGSRETISRVIRAVMPQTA